jgi:ankyrin repeat protein
LVAQNLVDFNAQGPYNGYTALHDSVWHGHIEAMRVLLDADVRTDLRGHDGRPAYQLAVDLGYSEMAAAIREKMTASLQESPVAAHAARQ